MESWSIGFDGDEDVERHAAMRDARPLRQGSGPGAQKPLLRLRIVSDYICPWCYIGLVRIERLRDEFQVELETCAYDLKPGLPPQGLPRSEAYAGRVYPPGYIENLLQLARDSGIDMKRPELVPNTRKAHEATEYARDRGRLWEFHHSVFKAYWEEERDIGDVDVLADVGASCGLDTQALRTALADGRYAGRIQEQIEWGRAAGVTGVPTVVFNDRFAVVGAQDYEVFLDVARRVASG